MNLYTEGEIIEGLAVALNSAKIALQNRRSPTADNLASAAIADIDRALQIAAENKAVRGTKG
jgi:hypothetical protein